MTIDWHNPPDPNDGLFIEVSGPGLKGNACGDSMTLNVRSGPRSRKWAGIYWPQVINLLREQCIAVPGIRQMVMDMVAALPPEEE